MRLDDVRFLFGYDRWATRRILAALSDVDAGVWTAPDAVGERGLGSILVHALGAHQRWRHRLSGSEVLPRPEQDPLPSPKELSEAWVTEWSLFDEWLATLDDQALGAMREGISYGRLLAHVVNHGTQHRSEAALLLTAAGRSPGDLDLVFYAEEIASGGPTVDPANS